MLQPTPQPAQFSIDSTASGSAVVIHLAGILDEAACLQLRQTLRAQPGDGAVIIEMSGLRYLPSAAIATLIQAQKQLRLTDRGLHLCQASEAVNEVLVVLNLATIMPIHRTLAQALLATTPGR